ncbi:MAG: CPBP family intramembrane metalloprotease [Myxococcales bacterium]|nr:CPBP family intramembrane metalloprotease [Myxococcales bacterium]
MPLPPTPRAPRLSRLGVLVVLYGGLTAAAVAWGTFRGQPDVFHLIGHASLGRTAYGIIAGLGFAALVVFLSRFSVHRFEWARTLHREFRSLLGPLTGGEIFLIAAASSIGEECFFRGALLPHLGIWLSSALFALPHIGPGVKFLPWTATSFIVGLVMGALFLQFGDLGGPIVAHFTINLLNLRHIARHELS